MEAEHHARIEEIKIIRENLPPDGKTRIGNLSQGVSHISLVDRLIVPVIKAAEDPGNPDHQTAQRIVTRAGEEWAAKNNVQFNSSDSNHWNQAKLYLAKQFVNEMKALQTEKPIQGGGQTNQEKFTKLQGDLQTEVNEARKKGLIIFNGAGNQRDDAAMILGDANASTNSFDSINGMVTVGAVNLKSPRTVSDDEVAEFSATGTSIEIAAPGVDIPVGPQSDLKKRGTTYSSPYAASVAALMVAANPKITPEQIEEILISGRVTTDLPGSVDGKGLLDPVKAVKEAKKLAEAK